MSRDGPWNDRVPVKSLLSLPHRELFLQSLSPSLLLPHPHQYFQRSNKLPFFHDVTILAGSLGPPQQALCITQHGHHAT